MKPFLRTMGAIVWKDLAAEWRSRELLSAMLVFALLVILIFNFALELDALTRNNVLILDEPTNHLDMESIESLNTALEKYKGTLVFVSHDREFVSSLSTRVLEIRKDGSLVDYLGGYEQYLSSQGIE